jgi:hypothetical protein
LTPSCDNLCSGGNAFHLLAKEGCKSALQKILYPDHTPLLEKKEIVDALLEYDDAGWSPLMRVLQADTDKNELVGLLLRFLDDNIHAINMEKIINPCQNVRTFVIP